MTMREFAEWIAGLPAPAHFAEMQVLRDTVTARFLAEGRVDNYDDILFADTNAAERVSLRSGFQRTRGGESYGRSYLMVFWPASWYQAMANPAPNGENPFTVANHTKIDNGAYVSV